MIKKRQTQVMRTVRVREYSLYRLQCVCVCEREREGTVYSVHVRVFVPCMSV